MSNMTLLLPPHEKVLARKFCEMVHEARLNHSESIVMSAVKGYIQDLSVRGKVEQVTAIKQQMKLCNQSLLKKKV